MNLTGIGGGFKGFVTKFVTNSEDLMGSPAYKDLSFRILKPSWPPTTWMVAAMAGTCQSDHAPNKLIVLAICSFVLCSQVMPLF